MRVLVTGASGQLGSYLLRELRPTENVVIGWTGSRDGELFGCPLQPVDLADSPAVNVAFQRARPDVILHAAAMARIADCYQDQPRAYLVNAMGTRTLAQLAAQARVRMILVSTDLVFDGQRGGYREEDPPAPSSVYGRTKLAAEQEVLAIPSNLVVRISLLFGPSLTGRPSFFDEQVTGLKREQAVRLFSDEWRTPLALTTAAHALSALIQSDCTGHLHLGGPQCLSRLEMGQQLAAFLKINDPSIVAVSREQAPAAEPRPRDTSLDCSRWRKRFPDSPWPTYQQALVEMLGITEIRSGTGGAPFG